MELMDKMIARLERIKEILPLETAVLRYWAPEEIIL